MIALRTRAWWRDVVLALVGTLWLCTGRAQADEERIFWVRYQQGGALHSARSDGSDLRELRQGLIHGVRLSPDGEWLAYGTDTTLERISSNGGNAEVLTSAERVMALAIAPDGRTLVYADAVSVVALDLASRAKRTLWSGYDARDLDFAPDGEWLLLTTSQAVVRLPLAGGPTDTLWQRNSSVEFVFGARFVSASRFLVMVDYRPMLYHALSVDLVSGEVTVVPGLALSARFAVSRDGQRVITRRGSSVELFDLATGVRSLSLPVSSPWSVEIGRTPTCVERCEAWLSDCPYLEDLCLCGQMYAHCRRACGVRTKVPECSSDDPPFPW